MKKTMLILGVILVASLSEAASVCILRIESQGNTRSLYVDCSNTGGRQATELVATSTHVVDNKTPIAKAKANYIRRLVEAGYDLKTDTILVKR